LKLSRVIPDRKGRDEKECSAEGAAGAAPSALRAHFLPASTAAHPMPPQWRCDLEPAKKRFVPDYFLKNRSRRGEQLAFLLYDPPPALRPGELVFIRSDSSVGGTASGRSPLLEISAPLGRGGQ
jgi:hypothetical protein